MNKYTLIWWWRTFVDEMKGLLWLVIIFIAFACLTSHAQEVEKNDWGDEVQSKPPEMRWELTIVQGNDLIDMPHRFATKELCIGLGVSYVRADRSLNGFVCEEEPDAPES